LGSFLENYKSSVIFFETFFHCASYVSVLTKNDLGSLLGDFFSNACGHPGGQSYGCLTLTLLAVVGGMAC
jgi:hypothetical protein